MKRIAVATAVAGVLALSAVSAAAERKINVWVSILPQRAMVEAIGGERVRVQTMVQPGDSPATYEPSPRQMAGLAEADLYFSIGVPFEKALLPAVRRNAPELKIIDTRRRIRLRSIEAHGHGHDHGGDHDSGLDPHSWLDPVMALVQAVNMADALCAVDPRYTDDYRRGLQRLAGELLDAHARAAEILAPLHGRTILVFHPAYGYFTDAYGLKQKAIELEGKEPTGRHLSGLIDEARREGFGVIFVQPQFARRSAEAVAQSIDARLVIMDPLAPDLPANIVDIAETIRRALDRETRE